MSENLQSLENEIEKDKFLWETIKRLDLYINSTNTKVTTILAFNTFLITSISLKYNEIISSFNNTNLKQLIPILLGLIFLISVLSIFFAFKVINPFLKSEGIKKEYKSRLFFGDISKDTIQSYIDSISTLDKKSLVDDLINQIHNLSIGLTNKFDLIKKSILCIYILLFFLAVIFGLKMTDSFIYMGANKQ